MELEPVGKFENLSTKFEKPEAKGDLRFWRNDAKLDSLLHAITNGFAILLFLVFFPES